MKTKRAYSKSSVLRSSGDEANRATRVASVDVRIARPIPDVLLFRRSNAFPANGEHFYEKLR